MNFVDVNFPALFAIMKLNQSPYWCLLPFKQPAEMVQEMYVDLYKVPG